MNPRATGWRFDRNGRYLRSRFASSSALNALRLVVVTPSAAHASPKTMRAHEPALGRALNRCAPANGICDSRTQNWQLLRRRTATRCEQQDCRTASPSSVALEPSRGARGQRPTLPRRVAKTARVSEMILGQRTGRPRYGSYDDGAHQGLRRSGDQLAEVADTALIGSNCGAPSAFGANRYLDPRSRRLVLLPIPVLGICTLMPQGYSEVWYSRFETARSRDISTCRADAVCT